MTPSELRSSAIIVNSIIATNNPRVATDALRREGYQSTYDIMGAAEIETVLLNIYDRDPLKWTKIVSYVPYRTDITNSSTSPEVKQTIVDLATRLNIITPEQNATSKFSLSDLFDKLKGIIGGNTVNNPSKDETIVEPAVKPLTVVIVVIVALAATYLLLK